MLTSADNFSEALRSQYRWGWIWDGKCVPGRISHSMKWDTDRYVSRCGKGIHPSHYQDKDGRELLFGNPGMYARRCQRCQDLAAPNLVVNVEEKREPRRRNLRQRQSSPAAPDNPTRPRQEPPKQKRLPFWERTAKGPFNPNVSVR